MKFRSTTVLLACTIAGSAAAKNLSPPEDSNANDHSQEQYPSTVRRVRGVGAGKPLRRQLGSKSSPSSSSAPPIQTLTGILSLVTRPEGRRGGGGRGGGGRGGGGRGGGGRGGGGRGDRSFSNILDYEVVDENGRRLPEEEQAKIKKADETKRRELFGITLPDINIFFGDEEEEELRACTLNFFDEDTVPKVLQNHADPTTRMECLGTVCNYDFKPEASLAIEATIRNPDEDNARANFRFGIICPVRSGRRPQRREQVEITAAAEGEGAGENPEAQTTAGDEAAAAQEGEGCGGDGCLLTDDPNPGNFDTTPELVWICPDIWTTAGVRVRRTADIFVELADVGDVNGNGRRIHIQSDSNVAYIRIIDLQGDGIFAVTLTCREEGN